LFNSRAHNLSVSEESAQEALSFPSVWCGAPLLVTVLARIFFAVKYLKERV
jgi:hypothetical protein